MIGIINLYLKDKTDDMQLDEISFDRSICESNDYCINISMDLNDKYVDLISQHKELEKNINYNIKALKDLDNEEDVAFYKQCKENVIELLHNAEYVSFDFDIPSIAKYLEDNRVLKTKKIVFNELNELDPQLVLDLRKYLPNYVDNIYIKLQENNSFISLAEYEQTILAIANIVEEVNKFDFSPLEKIMYVYDYVKERIYTEEAKDESYTISRDLTSALLGDKIVCAGYAKIFNKILKTIGFKSYETHLTKKDDNMGHARNEIYIQDEKYGIDGVYFFDSTWDSKSNKNDDKYLQKYRFFALTRATIERKEKSAFNYETMPYFSTTLAEEFEKLVKEKDIYSIPESMKKTINHMSMVTTGKSIIPIPNKKILSMMPSSIRKKFDINPKQAIKEVYKLMELYNTPIPADTLIEALFNIRKVQYYYNPEKYPLDTNDIIETAYHSVWSVRMSPVDMLLFRAGDEETQQKIVLSVLKEYKDRSNLDLRVKRVILTKMLSNINETKKLTYSK